MKSLIKTSPDKNFEQLFNKFLFLGVLNYNLTLSDFNKALNAVKNSSIEHLELLVGRLQNQRIVKKTLLTDFQLQTTKSKLEVIRDSIGEIPCELIVDIVEHNSKLAHLKCLGINEKPDLQYKILRKKIIGQDESLKRLLLYFYSVSRYWHSLENNTDFIQKPMTTQLVIGESGSGKSFMIEEAAKILNAKIIKIDASSLTAEGFVGPQITEIIYQNVSKIIDKGDRKRILVHIDEFDKISTRYNSQNDSVKGIAVANELLKYLDYKTHIVRGNANVNGYRGALVEIDIRPICFILSGAFTGLNKIESKSLGFKDAKNTSSSKIELAQIVDYGIPKELAGRIGSINQLNDVSEEMLRKILYSSHPIITDLQSKFKELGSELVLDSKQVEKIISLTLTKKIGVRGLASTLEEIYNDELINLLKL